jgi:hypothetical protein
VGYRDRLYNRRVNFQSIPHFPADASAFCQPLILIDFFINYALIVLFVLAVMRKIDSLSLTPFTVKADLAVFGCELNAFPVELQLAKEAIEELRISHPESTPSNVNAVYMSPWKSHTLTGKFTPLIQLMADLIRKSCIEHLKTDLDGLNFNLSVADCWGAIYEEASYTVPHWHFPSDFSTVVYLEMANEAAPIVFANSLVVQPVSGSAVIFPGNLIHHVPETKGRRVIVAINFIKVPKFEMKPIEPHVDF